jgi:hypothetical protein
LLPSKVIQLQKLGLYLFSSFRTTQAEKSQDLTFFCFQTLSWPTTDETLLSVVALYSSAD